MSRRSIFGGPIPTERGLPRASTLPPPRACGTTRIRLHSHGRLCHECKHTHYARRRSVFSRPRCPLCRHVYCQRCASPESIRYWRCWACDVLNLFEPSYNSARGYYACFDALPTCNRCSASFGSECARVWVVGKWRWERGCYARIGEHAAEEMSVVRLLEDGSESGVESEDEMLADSD